MREGQLIMCAISVPPIRPTGYFSLSLGDPPFIVIEEKEEGGKRFISCLDLDPSKIERDPGFPNERLYYRTLLSAADVKKREIP